MVGKSYQKKARESFPVLRRRSNVLKENEKAKCLSFKNEELPDHHLPTVKDWLKSLGKELLAFSESFVDRVKHETTGKVFVSDTFSINDINNSLKNFYEILDSSVGAIDDFHGTMCDYISTWKVTIGDAITCELSDSSVEIVECDEDSASVNVVDNNENKSENVKEGTNSGIKFGGLRIRKPSELNKLRLEDITNEGPNSLDASNDSIKSKNFNSVTNSCNDEEEIINKNESLESVNNTDSSVTSSTSKSESASANNPTTTTCSVAINRCSETNISKEDTNIDASGEEISSPLEAAKTSPPKKKSVINWDTSSESMSDSDWLVKKKNNEAKSSEGNKKKVLRKRIEPKTKKKTILLSSSDDDCSNLCNLGSLNQKKRKRKNSDSSSGSNSEHKDVEKSKRPKVKENLPSLLTLAENDSSEDSGPPVDDDLFTLNVDKYTLFKENNVFKTEDFLQSDIEERSLSVISDSSLDSIVNELEKTCAVKRRTEKQKSTKKTQNQSENKKKKTRRERDRLLDEKLTETDSSEAEKKWKELKMKKRIQSSDSEVEKEEEDVKEPLPKTPKKKTKKPRKTLFSDSDEKSSDSDSPKENEESDKESDSDLKPSDKKKRKRIQRHSDSSDSDGPTPSKSADGKGRKNIRKVLKEESLEKSTKDALKEEEERKKRIQEKQELYNELLKKASEHVEVLQELVLDFDVDTKKPLVSVDYDLVRKLKPHQAQGIKFMWDSCFESVKEAKKNKGSGCILAHCMGLGKTLQVISLVHTLLKCKEVDVHKVLVVCPFSTVQNWVNEFHKWLKDVGSGEDIEIYNMIKTAPNHRSYQLRDWERTGGVMVLGYNLFRALAAPKGKQKASIKKTVQETLLDPGPDVVICDEGHILKNEKTAISVVMNKLATRRRIVLTGTPLQNNLVEYHCMVQFVKPNLLGTRKEFQNRFVHPITNGQFEDSTTHDVKLMKRRAHVLHKMLDGIVQRKDYNVLTPYLPPKYEYVIHVKLTETQCKLYKHYLENFARTQKNEGGGLFTDFQHLMRICTHPRALLIHSDKEMLKADKEEEEDSEGSIRDFIDDDSEENSSGHESSSSKSSLSSNDSSKKAPKKRITRAQRASGEVSEEEDVEEVPVKRTEWWANIVSDEELEAIKTSSKLYLFFTILKHCEEIGDKLLVFSQSLYTLDLIEYFLDKVDENNRRNEADKDPSLSEFSSNWDKGIDYFRLDGGTSSDCRSNWCKVFNNRNNVRGRLFLISTKAGGLGINLTGANRVIIFDASWNPSFDVQSIFRVYRFGQDKPCYIYRFLSKGTMEEKIYERQVAKLSTSLRVIDEQQIDRHFSQTSLAELYAFNPDPPENRETPVLPKDRLMAELIQAYSDVILTYHQHDSLLENQEQEELNEEERRAAWLEFENEKNHVPPPMTSYNLMPNMNMNYLNQYRTGMKFDTMQFAMEYNNLLNILVQKVKMGNPQMPEEAVRKRAAEILAQQNVMQSLIQQQQQQMSMMTGWHNQNSALVNLPLRPFNTPPVVNNANNIPKRTVPVNPVTIDKNADKSEKKDKPQLIEIQDDE